MTLAEWRGRFREQRVAFRLAREVVRRWRRESADPQTPEGQAVPAHTLLPM